MNRSGMTWERASQARYIEPRLCPKSVKRGQLASSTHLLFLKKTKWSDSGARVIANRACAPPSTLCPNTGGRV
jgi:hypothetical protein